MVNQNPAAVFCDGLHGEMQLVAAVAASGAENIAGQALRVDAHQGGVIPRGTPVYKSDSIFGFVGGRETEDPKGAELRRKVRFGDLSGNHSANYIMAKRVIRRRRPGHPACR